MTAKITRLGTLLKTHAPAARFRFEQRLPRLRRDPADTVFVLTRGGRPASFLTVCRCRSVSASRGVLGLSSVYGERLTMAGPGRRVALTILGLAESFGVDGRCAGKSVSNPIDAVRVLPNCRLGEPT